ncbi:hypothetical protein DICPUDRAFT_81234 [Dictyostelium purpureum]|uniref:CMP/dCMP-type deaminase domain-containing protein n=1 Tax=Dictyostelium purpureum TaxID=5786 RepID=F0ZSW0_DICPU|nr:uncharacterized protein DICPUDRAFT_81234 [Dictyostelium purpureum]EGC32989.1 hypothetical protein DICPUDRAFT_81234 [Dictyostelium purpureum]|eukprot:XP_003290507.1 hypothetical protein DICPUDRAFT_81234 [Dictyostelium purpureum]
MDSSDNSNKSCCSLMNQDEINKQYCTKSVEELNELEKLELQNHIKFMKEAVKEGEKALKEGEVPVACVIVHNNQIIARGSNKTNIKKNGTRHAELEAFDQIFLNKELNERFKDTLLVECDLYVTVEPCLMCAGALSLAKINRVFFGCHNDKFGGNGSVYSLNLAPISNGKPYNAISGLLKDDAIHLLQLFYNQENTKAPVPNKRKRVDPEVLKKEREERLSKMDNEVNNYNITTSDVADNQLILNITNNNIKNLESHDS